MSKSRFFEFGKILWGIDSWGFSSFNHLFYLGSKPSDGWPIHLQSWATSFQISPRVAFSRCPGFAFLLRIGASIFSLHKRLIQILIHTSTTTQSNTVLVWTDSWQTFSVARISTPRLPSLRNAKLRLLVKMHAELKHKSDYKILLCAESRTPRKCYSGGDLKWCHPTLEVDKSAIRRRWAEIK